MKTKIEKLLRYADRGYLRLTNLIRPVPRGYIERVGETYVKDGRIVMKGWHFDGLGKATGIDITETTIVVCGYDTGVAGSLPTFKDCRISSKDLP